MSNSDTIVKTVFGEVLLDSLKEYRRQGDCPDSLMRLLAAIAESAEADHIYLLKGALAQEVRLLYAWGLESPEAIATYSPAVITACLSEGRRIEIADTSASGQWKNDPYLQRFNIQAAICVSDVSSGLILYMDSRHKQNWDSEISLFLDYAAVCLGQRQDTKYQQLVEAGDAVLNSSHSVKNILQMVGGAAEVIDFALQSGKTQRIGTAWGIFLSNIQRLKRSLTDLFDFAQQRSLRLSEVHVNDIITSVHQSVAEQKSGKPLCVRMRMDEQMPVCFLDGDAMETAVANLLFCCMDNAESGGVIEMATEYLAGAAMIRITVRDSGRGYGSEELAGLFEVRELPRQQAGSTAGLALARQIITQHRGQIRHIPITPQGNLFEVLIPIEKQA